MPSRPPSRVAFLYLFTPKLCAPNRTPQMQHRL